MEVLVAVVRLSALVVVNAVMAARALVRPESDEAVVLAVLTALS
jgi:hypothetical protein